MEPNAVQKNHVTKEKNRGLLGPSPHQYSVEKKVTVWKKSFDCAIKIDICLILFKFAAGISISLLVQ